MFNPTYNRALSVLQSQQPNTGELGAFPLIPVIIGAGTLILGGGTLWRFHEVHVEKMQYQKCIEKLMKEQGVSPLDAAKVCAGEVKKEGFKFGFNPTTMMILGASAFGLWFVTHLITKAGK